MLLFLLPSAPPRWLGLIPPTGCPPGPLAKFTPKFHVALAACRLTAGYIGKSFHQMRANTGHPPKRLAMAP